MIISTTDSIENSKITKYLGIVSGTHIYLVGGLFGGGLVNQETLYTRALNTAINNMTAKASALGANAIVGVSTDIASPGDLNDIIVVATGTAVKVQWNKTEGVADTSITPELCEPACNVSDEEQKAREDEDEDKPEEIEDENLVPNPSKEEPEEEKIFTHDRSKNSPENALSCPHCGEDLAFMGWTENDLRIPQVCPVCGSKILLKNLIAWLH